MRPRPTAGDLVAGVTVAFVLLPQSLAYAQLAGMPPERGLLAATLPPLAAALLASSPYLQTGPVALTSLMTFGALSTLAVPGSDEYVALGILLALVIGAVRLGIGVLGVGRIAYVMSPPVITGFVAAAAVLIVASQIPTLVGTVGEGGVVRAAVSAATSASDWDTSSLLLGAGTITVVLGAASVSRRFPAVILVALLGSAVGATTSYGGTTVGEIALSLSNPMLDLPWTRLPALLVAGAVIAVVGFAETAAIARSLAASDRRPWDPDREFEGQGLANVASAVAGGFPVGGSFSRTALNKAAGARTRWSGAVTGAAVLVVLPVAPQLFGSLPRAVLAGIVIGTVLSFLNPVPIVRLCRISPPQGGIALATFGATLALAPHVEYAVLVGIGLSIANHLAREMAVDVEATMIGRTLRLQPRGVLWFGSARALEEAITSLLSKHPTVTFVQLDLGGLGRIDYSGALVLRNVVDDLTAAEVEVAVSNPSPRSRRIIDAVLAGAPGPSSGEARPA